MGFVAGKSFSSGNSSNGSVPSQLTLTAPEAFTKGDPVFMDWKTGILNNLNDTVASAALASGPAITNYTAPEYGFQGGGHGNALILPDGSMVVLVITSSGNTGSAAVSLHKYSAKGVLINKGVVANYGSAGSDCTNPILALLKNGNIGVCFNGAAPVSTWAIMSPNLQRIATGNTSGAGATMHIQATNNGGFLLLSSIGLDFVSATGSVTNIITVSGDATAFASQDELTCNQLVNDNAGSPTRIDYRPANISNGGFGYFIAGTTALNYVQVNADGTRRVNPIVLTPLTTASTQIKFAVSSTGSIAWAITPSTTNGFFGVISDAGLVLRAATSAVSTAAQTLRLIADAAGGFLMFYQGAGTAWFCRYLTANGADVAGFPKAAVVGTTQDTSQANVYKLSTGTVLICSFMTSPYVYQYVFISLAGVITIGTVYDSGATGYGSQAMAALVVNDTVYGVAHSGNSAVSNGRPELVVFSIDKTGTAVVSSAFLGLGTASNGGFITTQPMRLLLDKSGTQLYAIGLAYPSGGTIVTLDLVSLTALQMLSVPNYGLANGRIRSIGKGLMFLGTAYSNFGLVTPPIFGMYVKPKSTVLIGVTAADADKGDPLVIETKGLFSLSEAWAKTAQLFDQSTNVPPGNAGSMNSGLINLKGF